MAMNQEKFIKLKLLRVTTLEQINNLNDLIHDEWFDVDQIQYDPKNKKVMLPYRRKFHNGPEKTIRNWLIYKLKEKDVVRSELRIHNVINFQIDDQAQLGRYTFNVAEYDPKISKLLIHCDPSLKIQFEVTELQIESEDLEIKGRARTSYLFGVIETDREKWNKP
jgi:hypothetical protein